MESSLDQITAVHKQEYGCLPQVVASAPGKVSLFGDYTEYSKGLVLAGALQERVFVAISPRTDGIVRFFSKEYNERKKTTTNNLKFRKEDRWANYPKGVLSFFSQADVVIPGLDITIMGTVPQGIGLGSSQALCLAASWAFDAFFETKFPFLNLIQMAHRTESQFLGLPTGNAGFFIQSQAQEDKLFFLDTRSYDYKMLDWTWPDGRIFVVNTHVPSSSFESFSSAGRTDCDLVLKMLGGGRGTKALRDYSKSDLREKVGQIPEGPRRKCLHIVEEMLRVQEARDLALHKDFSAMGKLMHRSHESLRDLFEISCPEIDWLVKRLGETDGVYGARLTGEETGACVVALGRPESGTKFKSYAEEYERIFGFKAELIISRPGAGVRVHASSELSSSLV